MREIPVITAFSACVKQSIRWAPCPSVAPWLRKFAEFPFDVRQLLYGRKPNVYRVLFTIEDDIVTILHIRRPRQQQLRP
jgi:hypothetical protein